MDTSFDWHELSAQDPKRTPLFDNHSDAFDAPFEAQAICFVFRDAKRVRIGFFRARRRCRRSSVREMPTMGCDGTRARSKAEDGKEKRGSVDAKEEEEENVSFVALDGCRPSCARDVLACLRVETDELT